MHAGIRCPYALIEVIARLLAGELLLKACESLKVAESSLFERSGENWSLLSATVAATTAFATVLTLAGLLSALALLLVLEGTAVRKDDAPHALPAYRQSICSPVAIRGDRGDFFVLMSLKCVIYFPDL